MEENNKNENIRKEVKEVMSKVVRVDNMTGNSGNSIPNQFEIQGDNFRLFQSYRSPIAMFYKGKTFIFRDWDYSNTTGKYRNMFLNEDKKTTLSKLKSGEYISVDFEV